MKYSKLILVSIFSLSLLNDIRAQVPSIDFLTKGVYSIQLQKEYDGSFYYYIGEDTHFGGAIGVSVKLNNHIRIEYTHQRGYGYMFISRNGEESLGNDSETEMASSMNAFQLKLETLDVRLISVYLIPSILSVHHYYGSNAIPGDNDFQSVDLNYGRKVSIVSLGVGMNLNFSEKVTYNLLEVHTFKPGTSLLKESLDPSRHLILRTGFIFRIHQAK